uniref:Uncharacterized protein n=1 Tax=Fagus sylvatica TaxID=28930 RepID=A0A2N9FPB5_FAGSY
MFESVNQASDSEGHSFGAALLITTTTTTSTTGSDKYGPLWRKCLLYVGICITFKKTRQTYAPLPQEPPAASEEFDRTSSVIQSQDDHVIDVDHSENEVDEEELPLETVAKIVKEEDFNSLTGLGGVDRVVARLRRSKNLEDRNDGGQDQQAWNTKENPYQKGFFPFFLKACGSCTNVLLLVSAGLSFATGIMEQGRKDGWHDGVAILAALVLLIAFPSVGNFLHERKKVRKLLKNMEKLKVNVERSGGQRQLIAINDVVVGDIVCLEKDDGVPADGLLVSGEGLVLDGGLKTKIMNQDQNPFLFSGSKVIQGHGRMFVTSVGEDTAMGKPLSLVRNEPNEKTVFQGRIKKPHTYMDTISLCVTVIIGLVVLIRLLHEIQRKDLDFDKCSYSNGDRNTTWNAFCDYNFTVLLEENGTAIRGTPHNLSACGTMGLVNDMYIDVTGGLMCERVEVSKLFVGEKYIKIDGDSETSQVVRETLKQGIDVSVLVSKISVSPTNNDLFISWAKPISSLNVKLLDQSFHILEHKICIKKGSGALMRKKGDNEPILHLHWSGAAVPILEMCSNYYDSKGKSHAMKDRERMFKQVVKDMEDGGLIPIAFAHRQTEFTELREDGLNLLAIVGLKYFCKEEFESVVGTLRDAGVSVKLVSEDEVSVVRAMACELEIFRPGSEDVALKGEEVIELITSGRMKESTTVVGSCLPENKLRLIQWSKRKGHVVAFFGGLTRSDILALKEADVGITEEKQSTQLAIDISDITLKGFRSLVPVLKFGRCCYHNIQKFMQLQFTACISGLLISLVMTMVTGESPITGIELMWLNLVMCLLGGLFMVMELKSEELLCNQPAKGNQSLITKDMWGNIAIQVLYQVSILLIFQLKGQAIPNMNDDDVRKTMVFNTFILCQIFNQFNAMDLVKWEVFWVCIQSYSFLVTLADVMALQVVLIQFLASITHFAKLNAVQWASCFLIAALPWGFDWALKRFADIIGSLFLRLTVSYVGFSYGMPWPCLSYLGVPLFTFLVLLALPGLFTIINHDVNVPSGYK